jgi:cytochrome oxidase Cu insertion factor (SCO1/SenC/PrrC family)
MSTPDKVTSPMTTRRRLMLLAPAGVLAAGLAGVAAWSQLRPNPSAPVTSIGGPFALLDGNGHTVTDQDFRGRWMLVYFGYTHCPDACPTALQDMATALDDLGAKRQDVAPIFITVDPERDTPAVMKDYVANFGPGITGLSGSPDAAAQAARAYRVYFAKHPTADGYDMDHSSIIYLMDPQGRFIANFTHETSPEQIAARLRALV